MSQGKQLGLFDPPPKAVFKDPPAMRHFRRGRWFDAKKKSRCNSCGDKIDYGDRIWLIPYHSAICIACALAHQVKSR
jgi:hypothetical protein